MIEEGTCFRGSRPRSAARARSPYDPVDCAACCASTEPTTPPLTALPPPRPPLVIGPRRELGRSCSKGARRRLGRRWRVVAACDRAALRLSQPGRGLLEILPADVDFRLTRLAARSLARPRSLSLLFLLLRARCSSQSSPRCQQVRTLDRSTLQLSLTRPSPHRSSTPPHPTSNHVLLARPRQQGRRRSSPSRRSRHGQGPLLGTSLAPRNR